MNIKDRYIAKTLFIYTLTVLLVWLSVYSFFNFMEEINSIGTSNYTSFQAMKYIALKMPDVVYNHSASVILLGCILGMGHLATTNQLIMLRVSGISILKMTIFTIKTALIFVFFTIIIGELIVPFSTNYAENQRSQALGLSTKAYEEGFWIKDGQKFINVKQNLDGKLFLNVNVFELSSSNSIKTVITAENAEFSNNILQMNNVEIYDIDNTKKIDNISIDNRNTLKNSVSFDSDLLEDLRKPPEDLTTWKIIKQIKYLSDNKLRSDFFEIELYERVIKPFTLTAMIIIGMLFIFETNRSTSLGRKIFFGVAIALSFEMLSRIGSAVSIGFEISPIIVSTLPSLMVLLVSSAILVKKSIQ